MVLGDNDQSYAVRMTDRSGGMLVQSERRRRWSDESKLRIVQETLEPGAIVSLVARRHDIGTGQLYTWRKQLLAGAMSGFVPVEINGPELGVAAAVTVPRPGLIEIATSAGLRVTVGGHVERAALKTVLGVISELRL
jgi:transposase